jgi:Transposase DDE domain group 1
MMKRSGFYPVVRVAASGVGVVSQAGGVLLTEAVRAVGVDRALSAALAPWRKARAVHDPGKTVLDLALALALGGDCLADVAVLRAEPALFGPVASDPTVSRLVDTLAAAGPKALAAIRAARALARQRAWSLAGPAAPTGADGQVTVDLDATLVTAHSDKEQAAKTYKKGYGFHPLWAFADHGGEGTGEPLAVVLRKGNAGSNTVADHIAVTRLALAQLPKGHRRGRKILVRTDGAGGTHGFLNWLTKPGRSLSYSVGFTIGEDLQAAIPRIPKRAWSPAYNADGQIREGAWVCEVTDMLDLTTWPKGMRVILRKERPHPGAQLRITDVDGHRITAFATNTPGRQLADLELRHRRRARCEDRIRGAKDTGLRNLPLHDFAQNTIWCEIVALACELTAWMQMLALTGPARRYEPKKLRLRLFSAAAQLVRTARQHHLRIAGHWPWAEQIHDAFTQLRALPAPG